MPGPLSFYHPETTADAVRLLAELGEDGKVVAGGTALTLLLRQGLITPRALVSLARVGGLAGIEVRDGDLLLGALVRHREVETSQLVRAQLPVVADTFGKVANVRIRNVATVGGVLAESDYASDPPALLRALDAVVETVGPAGERSIPIADFFVAFYETSLHPDEIVTGVRIPVLPEGTGAVYEKYVTRSSEDRPCVGVAAVVRVEPDGTCRDLRVAVGAAAEVPQRFREVEERGVGSRLEPDVIRDVADRYAAAIEPLGDIRGSAWYRREMVRVWVGRAIESAHREALRSGHD